MQDVTHLAMASELTAGKEQQHTVGFDMLSALTTTKSDKPETTALQMKLSGLEGLPRHTLAQQRQIRELRQRIGYALAREAKEKKESGTKKGGEDRNRDRRDRRVRDDRNSRRNPSPDRRRKRDDSYDSYSDRTPERRDRRRGGRDYGRDRDRYTRPRYYDRDYNRSRRYSSRSLSPFDNTPPRRERKRDSSSSSEHFEAPEAPATRED